MSVMSTLPPRLATAAPGLAWVTDVGAQVFAVDGQTNVYANTGGTVFKLAGSGVPVATNVLCSVSHAVARRDGSGNLYLAGSFDGQQDFGGTTLTGGWTNNAGHYTAGWPTCFLAKYNSAGTLQWVKSFGAQASRNNLTDLALDPSGGFYTGYDSSGFGGTVTHLSDTGAVDWTWTEPGSTPDVYAIKLGGASTSNCCVLSIRYGTGYLGVLHGIDRSGTASSLGQYPLQSRSLWSTNGEPVVDASGQVFQAGQCFPPPSCTAQWLRKATLGADVWEREITVDTEYVLARDPAGNVYTGGADGLLAQYSDSGSLLWSNNFVQPCLNLVADPSGNRFLSFADGSVAELQPDGTGSSSFTIASDSTNQASARLSLQSKPQAAWNIYISSNLTSWALLGKITNNAGGLQFSDPNVSKWPARYYKAVPAQ